MNIVSEDWRDRPVPVRQGEELNRLKLERYLKQRIDGLEGDLVVEQYPEGFSNLTYALTINRHRLVLRRPPFGAKIKSAHDMGREFRILSRLINQYPKVPRPLLYCDDDEVIGAPFYVMTRLEGVILRAQMPAGKRPTSDLMARIASSFVENFAALHAVDYRACGLGDLGKPEGYVQRQIEGWTKRYQRARTDRAADSRATVHQDAPVEEEAVVNMEAVGRWLAESMPPETDAALIHNDYKYDNIVLDPNDWSHIVGVLDWEMATIGDPLMDLGSLLGYWIEAGDPAEVRALQFSPTTLPGNPARQQIVDLYGRLSDRDVSNIVFYFVYGLFKLAVIVQQIYARYRRGYSQDPRFAGLIHAVRACGLMATQAIKKNRIDRLFEP